MPGCRKIFETDGQPREVAANQPLPLDDPQSVWLVCQGRVELFAAPRDEGTSSHGRRHLGHVAPGQLMLSAECDATEQVRLVAFGLPGTKVFRLPFERFQQLAADPETTAEAGALLDQWVETLTSHAGRGAQPKVHAILAGGQESRLKAGTVASPPRNVWITSTDGSCRFLGRIPLSLGADEAIFPLADAGWLECPEAATVRTCETKAALDDPRAWNGLRQFHRAILACALAAAESDADRQRARLGRKALAEVEQTASALSQLAASTAYGSSRNGAARAEQDALLAACRLVADRLGIEIRAPSNYGVVKLDDPVSAIARASAMRIRRVMLKGKWWREDNGPLLGFLREGERPVALLPTAVGYDVVDPLTGSRAAVTDATRQQLQVGAYCCYRSLPGRPLRMPDILKFSLFGTRRDWIALTLLGLAGALLGLFVPIATGLIVGDVIPGADRRQLVLLIGALVVNAVVMTIFEFVQGIATLRLESRMDSSLEAGVWDRLLNLPASFFRQYSTGDLAMRAMGIGQIRQVLTQAAMSSLLTLVFSLVSFGLLFYYDVRLAILGTMLFLVVVAATCIAAYVQLPIERLQYEVRGKVAGMVLQILTGISRLRVAGAENRALAWWATHYSQQVRLAFRSQMIANGLATFLAAVPILSTMAIFVAVAWFPSEKLSLAAFLAFSAAFAQIMAAAVTVGGTVTSILDIVPLYERSKPILETPPEAFTAKADPGTLDGSIEIGHVSFRYHEDGPLVLDDVSINIRPGEFVAFVGPSGAGKSTILRLLLGFETPEQGSIYYGREDFALLDRQAVRRQIGVVFQNSRLTSGDIFRNIVGSAPLTFDDAWEAARLSGLDQDIDEMPMGMHTVISEAESTLSGGQRQRLLIARAIVTRPRILYFDEATSALDNVTQAKVAKSLESLKATRIVVAHRLSTIINADQIYVIERGRIVQRGTYQELMAEGGLFGDLARRQLL